MKIFEYSVIYVPKKKDGEARPAIIVPITAILAADSQAAMLAAARKIPAEYEDRLEDVEVAVRPF